MAWQLEWEIGIEESTGEEHEVSKHAPKMDKTNLKIIGSLNADSRKSVTQIAKETGISRPTIISRLDKMMKQNIIRIVGVNIRELGFQLALIA